MTNYLKLVPALLVIAGCARAEQPKPATAKPAVAKPVTAKPATAAPAAPAAPAAKSATGGRTYTLVPQGGSLDFGFVQEGAATQAQFRQFTVTLVYDDKNPAAGSLDVKVQMASVFTDYEDRDNEIRGAELLDVKAFPTAEFRSTSLVKTAKGVDAVGKLTVHGVTRDLKIPLAIRPLGADAATIEVSGNTSVNRLDYGVGKGDWASTESVANEIKLQWKVKLAARP